MLQTQLKLALSPYFELYDKIIPKDHLLRQINDMIDFSFVYQELKDKYSITLGRKAIDPIMMFKYLLLKILYPCSDRDLVDRAMYDMSFKYFLGLMPDDDVIDSSSLTKFRTLRLKDSELLNLLLGKSINLAIEKGVMTMGTVIVDSTHTKSKYNAYSSLDSLRERAVNLHKELLTRNIEINIEKIKSQKNLVEMVNECQLLIENVSNDNPILSKYPSVKEKINFLEEGISDTVNRHEVSYDKDAKRGYKSTDAPFFGYKTHIGMSSNRLIVAATVTTGEAGDGLYLQGLVEQSQQNGFNVTTVVGDRAYGGESNIEFTKENKIALVAKLHPGVFKERTDGFYINKDSDMLMCPMGYQAMSKKMTKTKKAHYHTYKFDMVKCEICTCKENCPAYIRWKKKYVGIIIQIPKQVHIEQLAFSQTDEFKESMKERYKIEAKNGELKNIMRYDKADSYGLKNMEMQCALTLFTCNIKRILTLMNE